MNRPSARTTSALPRHNGRRRSLRFIHAHIHARARVHSYSFFSRGSSLSLSPSRASSLYLPVLFPLSRSPQSSSLCVFSRFSIVSGINAPHDRPRYAEKNPSSSRSARLAVASWRTYRYLLVGGTLRGSAATGTARATATICALDIY